MDIPATIPSGIDADTARYMALGIASLYAERPSAQTIVHAPATYTSPLIEQFAEPVPSLPPSRRRRKPVKTAPECQLLTTREVAAMTDLSISQVQAMARAGTTLKGGRIGKLWRFSKTSVETWLSSLERPTTPCQKQVKAKSTKISIFVAKPTIAVSKCGDETLEYRYEQAISGKPEKNAAGSCARPSPYVPHLGKKTRRKPGTVL